MNHVIPGTPCQWPIEPTQARFCSLKNSIRRVLDSWDFITRKTFFSQLGQDAVLEAYFGQTTGVASRRDHLLNRLRLKPGLYVDVGAYSPKRLSNTYWFYCHGWKGITIEPNPLVAEDFRRLRPRDKHLTMAVSSTAGRVFYFSSGYTASSYIGMIRETPPPGFSVLEVDAVQLKHIFAEHVPYGQTVHLMSVGCEGHDLEVLKSNDWGAYRALVVLAEDYMGSLEALQKSELVNSMQRNDYELFSWTMATVMFRDLHARTA